MDPARVELELRADRAPVAEVGRRLPRLDQLRPAERDRAGREPGTGEQVRAE